MRDLDDDIAVAEREWSRVPDVTREESPETALAVKAHVFFQEKILLASGIATRRDELGMTGPVTHDNFGTAKIIVGLCRKARGDIERNRKLANEDALAWQRAINKRAGELKAEVEEIESPLKAGVKAIEDAKESAKRAREEAERKAIEDAALAARAAEQAVTDAKRAAEAEANRAEAERLATERKALEAARDRLNAELNARIAQEHAEFEERQRIANAERLEQERIAAQLREAERAEREKIEKELAEYRAAKTTKEAEAQRIALAEAERFQAQQAAERQRLRLEAIEPDVPKIRRFAAAIKLTRDAVPSVSSDDARATIERAVADLEKIATELLNFGTK